ncbi:MAG: hypothetical protein IJI65_01355 [Lachnospiraceae bacterium]|nr:hypothetical protein [Lachnospiraceae bacterium]MBQ6578997.1 hypothetical protein [Bacteroidales bacterium]
MSKCLFRNYGLKKGEPVSIIENSGFDKRKGSALFQERPPNKVKVIGEYPYVIHLRGTWISEQHTYEYDFCVEKASIYCGEVELKRLRTGEKLKAGELLSDYLKKKGEGCDGITI